MNSTINVHAQFNGFVADVLDEIIRSGRASSRTEAIRLALLYYYDQQLKNEEGRLAVEKMQRIDKEIEEGKRKVMTQEEFLKLHPELKED